MEFWIFFVCVCVGFVFLERIVPKRYKKFVPICFMFFITFISAFRYRIGWDYQSYETMFYTIEWDSFGTEISFRILAIFFRDLGFDFQIIFVIYSVLTSFFVWKGLRNYFDDSFDLILSIVSYALIRHLYWDSFSIIRQMLALSIFFWGSKFIFERHFVKYLIIIIFTTLVHFSSIVLIACYFIPIRKFNKITYVFLFLCAISVNILEIAPAIMKFIFSIIDIYGGYIKLNSVGFTIIAYSCIWIVMLIFVPNKEDKKNIMSLNMFTIAICLMWIFSFSAPLFRIALYFQIFQIVQTVIFVCSFKNKQKIYVVYLVLLIYAFLFFKYVSDMPSNPRGISHPFISANNINYSFNFKLLQ